MYNFNQILTDIKKVLSDLNLLPLSIKLLQLINTSGHIFNLYRHYCKEYDAVEFANWQKKVAKVFEAYTEKNHHRPGTAAAGSPTVIQC
jgi:hypothetical protein